MKRFVRIVLQDKTTHAVLAQGILLRDEESNFHFITNAPRWGGAEMAELSMSIADVCFRGATYAQHLQVEHSDTVSFTTLVLMMMHGLHGIEFSNFDITIQGDVERVNAGETILLQEPSASAQEEQAQDDIHGIEMKSGYTDTNIYSGFRGYHGFHSLAFNIPLHEDKPWKIGVELEVYARSRNAYDKIVSARSNWFQCERDGSLTENNLGIEMKTIPLKACDATNIEFWDEPMRRLSELAVSKRNVTTGLHVHIGKEILGDTEAERDRTIDKLAWFYTYLVEDIPANHAKNVVICGREEGYHASSGKTETGDVMKKWMKSLAGNKELFHDVANSVTKKVKDNRGDVNLQNLNGYGTVEFRKGKGIISRTRLTALCSWWEQMCLYCRYTEPVDLDFDAYFAKACASSSAISYFFNRDEEC